MSKQKQKDVLTPIAETKHYWLYALKLEQGKYYIGITAKKDPQDRIREHMMGYYGAQWVKKYRYLETLEIIDLGMITNEKAFDLENHRTLQYMKKYGYQNVRGGRFAYSGKYIKVGDTYVRDEDWKMLLAFSFFAIVFLILIILSLINANFI